MPLFFLDADLYCGKEIPAGLRIKFIENEGADRTFVLPDLVTGDLSDEDLGRVAGGSCAVYRFSFQ